jgi:hypothetical protein
MVNPVLVPVYDYVDYVKEFAIEIWKDVQLKTSQEVDLNCERNGYYSGSGRHQPNPVQYHALVAQWARFKTELMQGFECSWIVHSGNWLVQYRFLSEGEFPGPPSNELTLYCWKMVRNNMKVIEATIESRKMAYKQRSNEEIVKRLLETSAKRCKTQTLILLTDEQYTVVPQIRNLANFVSLRGDIYRCDTIWKLDPRIPIYDELKKEHLKDIGNPAVLIGDWYVVAWKIDDENAVSCCTIC